MLTDTEAFALLELYGEPLRGGEWANTSVDFACDFVPPVAKATSTRHARALGARLRLALGVAQAISCCRGFDPATNMPFWRHAVATLWLKERASPDGLMLSRKSFSHIGIQWNLDTPDDDTFWIGFFFGTPACNAVLSAVQNKLRPHLEIALVPPLRVVLSRCVAYNTVCASQVLPHAQRNELGLPYGVVVEPQVDPHVTWSILRAAQLAPAATTWSNAPCHVGLNVHFCVGFGAATMRHTLALLQRRVPHGHLQFTIDQITIALAPLKPPRVAEASARSRRALVSRGRPLGELLRGLLVDNESVPRVRTVELTGCSHADYRHVGAAFSAVALASPPVAELRCRGILDNSDNGDLVLQLAWLAFALHRRAMATNTPVALELDCTDVAMYECERLYITQLLALGTPLRDVVGEALRLRFGGNDDEVARLQVECERLGSTVRFTRGIQLYFEPFRGQEESGCVTLVAEQDEALDLVAHITNDSGEAFVGVVYAGFGLVWAPATSVVAWHRLDDDVVMAESDEPRTTGLPLASLTVRFKTSFAFVMPATEALRVTGLSPLCACDSLTSLATRAVLSRDDLALVLDCFPRLESLNLDRCIVDDVEPLTDAYRRGASAISKLSLLSVRDLRFQHKWVKLSEAPDCTNENGDAPLWLGSFVDVLVASHGGHRVLRELSLDFRGLESEAATRSLMSRLAQAMASNTLALARLHVRCRWLSPSVPMDVAVLSVLRAFGCGTSEVARVVLAMAEGSATRQIAWDLA